MLSFPSREELKERGYCPRSLELYDLWREAHGEAQELAARLPAVFGDPARPLITLSVARGYDDEWFLTKERGEELAALDHEQHWTEVTAEAVQNHQEYFTFSDPEGWRFYLPAFLRHYLAGFPLYHWDAVYSACLTRRHFDLFTPEQVAFVDEFVALCRTWEAEP
ncbi:MAG TPA: DUF6714 family protein [Verrucomicrobiales bacterium]|jgi:hypothetical protein|nr:DUF6714 family protein [Verrucomicrobiales bacterium]